MGRPLNKKYFANRDVGGAGGDTVTSVPVTTAGTLYSQGLTATLSAPNIADGVQATITPVVNLTTGAVTSFTVTNAGSGYTSAPTVTLVKPTTQTATARHTNTNKPANQSNKQQSPNNPATKQAPKQPTE